MLRVILSNLLPRVSLPPASTLSCSFDQGYATKRHTRAVLRDRASLEKLSDVLKLRAILVGNSSIKNSSGIIR